MSERISRKLPLVVTMLSGSLALSGCSTGNIDLAEADLKNVLAENIFIDDGSTLRTDPTKLDDADGGTNACVIKRKAAIPLDDQQIFIADGLGSYANGPWVGIEVANLPADVQGDCADDKDGIVWVVQSQVFMSPTSLTLQN